MIVRSPAVDPRAYDLADDSLDRDAARYAVLRRRNTTAASTAAGIAGNGDPPGDSVTPSGHM